ncbi:glycosyltransferase family 2 protein [Fertoeibacter niger]
MLDDLRARVSPHGRIMALSMMKDEGPYLLEWVAHHLAVGFTDILVYTNDCSDGTDDMLIRLQELGLAHHRRNDVPPGLRPQPSALNYAEAEPLVAASDWLLVFDADEFLCIRHGNGGLDGMIADAKAKGANGIVITWRIFGSGGVHHWSRAPVTEQYLRAAPPDWNKGWGVKTLFQYDTEHWKLGIHRPKMKNKWLETDFPASVKWLNGSGAPMEEYFKFRGWRSITRTVGYGWAQMNHYAVKSVDAYAIRKFRGNVNLKADKYNADYWALQDRNEVADDTMLRYAAARGRIFDALLADPVLHRLHHAALDRAEARLAEFKGTDAYAALVEGLKAASLVPITEVAAKPPQARDPAKIAALMSRVEKTVSEKQTQDRRAAKERAAKGQGARVAEVPTASGPYLLHPDLSGPDPSGLGPAIAWFPCQGIALPCDARLFTASALSLIRAGKFGRSLARHLPKLLAQSRSHLELGAGCGFQAALLARALPALTQVVQEADSGWQTALHQVWARNAIRPGPCLALETAPLGDAAALAALLARQRPESLAIGAPDVTPALLAAALDLARIAPPRLILLTGRALPGAAAYAALFDDLGLHARPALDPQNIAAAHA